MKAELWKRRLGGQVERLIAAAKVEGERMMDQSITTHLPDGSAVLRMPGATATVGYVSKEPEGQ